MRRPAASRFRSTSIWALGRGGIRGYLRDVAAGGEQVEVDLDLGRLDGEERGGGGGALGGRGTSSRRPGGRGGGLCMLDCTGGACGGSPAEIWCAACLPCLGCRGMAELESYLLASPAHWAQFFLLPPTNAQGAIFFRLPPLPCA
jgi:hypothetical protein